jgi:hypothetical protein
MVLVRGWNVSLGVGSWLDQLHRDALHRAGRVGLTGAVGRGFSFQIALVVLAGSAWFWSRAALAARFGINDGQRHGAAPPTFNWAAFIWLPRLMLVASFLVGIVITLL